MNKAETIRQGFLNDVRRLATRGVGGLAQTRITPNALTATGVTLCIGSSVFVYFSYRHELAFFWAAAALFVAGSLLDILDGALARASGKVTPFGAFVDSTTDRISEAFMLGAVVLVFARGSCALLGRADDRSDRRLVSRQLHARTRRGDRAARQTSASAIAQRAWS